MDMSASPESSVVWPREVGPCDAGLTLMVGPPNSGKLGRVFTWWRQRLPWHPLIVVPNTVVAREVTREFLGRANGVIGQSPALTFDGLVREILGRSPVYLSEFQRQVLLTDILHNLPLTTLRPSIPMPGLPSAVAALLQELAESGRSEREMDRALSEWAREGPQAAALAEDLRRVREAYAAACSTLGLEERAYAAHRAGLRIQEWSKPVIFYGFTSFTEGQRCLVDTLAAAAPVLLAFDNEQDRPASLVPQAEVDRWKNEAVGFERLPAQPRAYSCAEIFHLERRLFCDGQEEVHVAAEEQGVHFLLAAGERAEAELVAQHVVSLMRSGFSPQDIAIVVREPRSRGRLLEQVFDSCGIPYQLDAPQRVCETGLGNAFLNAVRGWAFRDPEALTAFLRSPYSGLSWEQSADLELHYRRSRGGYEGLRCLVEDQAPHMLQMLSQILDAGEDLPRDWSALRLLVREMFAAGSGDTQTMAQNGAPKRLEDDLYAVRALQNAFDEWALVRQVISSAAEQEVALFLECVSAAGVGRGNDASLQGVSVLSPARARARRFAAVFVLGLVEGEFPARTDRPSLLTESQKKALEFVAGPGILARHEDNEEALFLSAVSRPWQVLFLSARDADDDGTEVLPSRFWAAAKHLLGRGEGEHERRGLGDVAYAVDVAPGARHYARAQVLGGQRGGKQVWERPPAELRQTDVRADLAALDRFSPSGLESYLACPFAWFLNRVVGIEDIAEELDGRVIGSLLHAALSRAYRQASAEGMLPLGADHLPRAFQLASAIVDDLASGDLCPGTAAERRLVSWRVGRLVETVFVMEANWQNNLVMVDTEVTVGGQSGVDIGGVSIVGRVDRLDEQPISRGLFVVDYKSGKIPSPKKIGTPEGLQLPLYLLVLGAQYPERPLIGGAYVSPGERRRSGIVLDLDQPGGPHPIEAIGGCSSGLEALNAEATQQLMKTVRDIAAQAAEAMRRGDIAPLPNRECPSWCDLRSACRAYRGRVDQ